MKCAVLLLSVVAAARVTYGVIVQEEWKVVKVEHKTQYLSPEEGLHIKPEYDGNVNKVQQINGHKIQHKRTTVPPLDLQQVSTENLPTEVDWVKFGALPDAVYNQFKDFCQSGWAFSATGAIEGQYFIHKKRHLNPLSAQELIDCSDFYGNEGCVGTAARAFASVAGRGRIASEQVYPYYPTQGQCRLTRKYPNVTVSGVYINDSGDEQTLQRLVAFSGPASVAIHSQPESFQLYDGGVYYHKDCADMTDKLLDHEVLVVGYGPYGSEQPGGDYWLIKNSWGPTWGEKGYMKLARNRGNHCGVASRISYPLL